MRMGVRQGLSKRKVDGALLVHSVCRADFTGHIPSCKERTWERRLGAVWEAMGCPGLQGELRGPQRSPVGMPMPLCWGLTRPFEKAGNREALDFAPTNACKGSCGGHSQINPYFKNKRQARGHSQKWPRYSQGWKADLQSPKIRQKARAGDRQTWKWFFFFFLKWLGPPSSSSFSPSGGDSWAVEQIP